LSLKYPHLECLLGLFSIFEKLRIQRRRVRRAVDRDTGQQHMLQDIRV